MLRLTKGQVATTWKKKKGAFSTAKSGRGGRRKSKRVKWIEFCLIIESAASASLAMKVVYPLFPNPLDRI